MILFSKEYLQRKTTNFLEFCGATVEKLLQSSSDFPRSSSPSINTNEDCSSETIDPREKHKKYR